MPTIPDPLYDPDGRVSLAVYEYLEEATPEERTEMVLKLIEEHPQGRLELLRQDGKRIHLEDIDLGIESITALAKDLSTPPKWASPELDGRFGVCLCNACLTGACLRSANLRCADFVAAHLESADLLLAELQGADLQYAYLRDAHLLGAHLEGAHLRGARLENANLLDAHLEGADLQRAHLERLDLSVAHLECVSISGAWLDNTRFSHNQLGGAIGEELRKEYPSARNGYLILKQNFESLGDYAGASWAYCKERRMEKLEAWQKGRRAEQSGDWPEALRQHLKAVLDQLVELLCNYGEGFWRIVLWLGIIWFDFALLYAITGEVLADRGTQHVTTRNLVDLLSFSLGTMVTIAPPGLIAYDSLLMRIAMPAQAFISIFLAGLLGFVAGNRIRRS